MKTEGYKWEFKPRYRTVPETRERITELVMESADGFIAKIPGREFRP